MSSSVTPTRLARPPALEGNPSPIPRNSSIPDCVSPHRPPSATCRGLARPGSDTPLISINDQGRSAVRAADLERVQRLWTASLAPTPNTTRAAKQYALASKIGSVDDCSTLSDELMARQIEMDKINSFFRSIPSPGAPEKGRKS